ncbi:MAG: hypothetical protein J7L44_03630 [Candidatus Diapherotrites archaeon]|nr:hypothetical protein [Candidatus Diapherotrites archaeon]
MLIILVESLLVALVDESIIIETIKKMKESGLEDNIIISTLEDVGIAHEKAAEMLDKALGRVPVEKPKKPEEEEKEEESKEEIAKILKATEAKKPETKPEHEAIAEKTAEKVKQHLEETKLEHDLHHTTMHAALAQQSAMLEDLHKSVKNIVKQKPKVPKTMEEKIVQMQVDIEKIKSDLAEAKADIAAMKTLMNKVLEVTRKILLRLP